MPLQVDHETPYAYSFDLSNPLLLRFPTYVTVREFVTLHAWDIWPLCGER